MCILRNRTAYALYHFITEACTLCNKQALYQTSMHFIKEACTDNTLLIHQWSQIFLHTHTICLFFWMNNKSNTSLRYKMLFSFYNKQQRKKRKSNSTHPYYTPKKKPPIFQPKMMASSGKDDVTKHKKESIR